MDSRSLTQACQLLEHNQYLSIGWIVVTIEAYGEIYTEVQFDGINSNLDFEIIDRLFDVDTWRRFGRAVQNSMLNQLELHRHLGGEDEDAELVAASERCIDVFIARVKHNTSIMDTHLNLMGASTDDISEFIQNNNALKNLSLQFEEPVSIEQSSVISRAIRNVHLEWFSISSYHSENDGSLEQILEGCTGVDNLIVRCEHSSHCIAVAAFLRDRTSVLKELRLSLNLGDLDDDDWSTFGEQAAREISASLVENTCLKSLKINFCNLHELDCFNIEKLLCDARSIESLSNSNHTLEKIVMGFGCEYEKELSSVAMQCLKLNSENENKYMVIRNKILRFYFVGNFDITPFVKMPLLILPELLSQIEGNAKWSAIYGFLQCMPGLCDVTERESNLQPGSKRQKLSWFK